MSVSIYYEAKRNHPLSPDERERINRVEQKFSVDENIRKHIETGEGLNWESFGFYDEPYAPGIILSGSTKLPDNTETATWSGIEHWCSALTEIRRHIPDATWRVAVEDHKIPWDATQRAYDPSK